MAIQQNGIITTDINNGSNDSGKSVTLQADGKILVAGSSDGKFALVRYNSNGSLDTIFDMDGKVTTNLGSYASGGFVALQADGKIIVAGSSNNAFALVRYNSNGSLDTTFSGDGKLTTNIGTSYDYASAVTLQADGKILVAGYSFDSVTGFSDVVIARYNRNGSLDTTFDNDGKVITDFVFYDYGYSVTLQADGKILVAGYSDDSRHGLFTLMRYNSDGSLDTTFNGDGKVTAYSGSGSSVTLQADGKILVAGNSGDNDFALIRYNTDGSLDTNFSSNYLPTGTVNISNTTPKLNQILTASNTLADTDGLGTITYTWQTGTTVLGTGDSYTTTLDNLGKTITVTASYTDGLGNFESVSSTATSVVAFSKLVLIGTTGNDALTGSENHDNVINGIVGNDTLNGSNGNDVLIGGSGKDILNGSSGNDLLYGGGANDKLIGETGRDSFIFNTALSTAGIDIIADFSPTDDTIKLKNVFFTALAETGRLNSANFVTSNTAVDNNDFIIYNNTTGALFYDADGSGLGSAVQIAVLGLTTHPTLTNADFVVI
jgi:uncharacterized delta-60 repeat protein